MTRAERRDAGRRHGAAWIALILVGALLVRVGFVVAAPQRSLVGDPILYDQFAASIAGGQGFPRLTVGQRPSPTGTPTALHPPAYPVVLAGAYALTGHGARLDRGLAWIGGLRARSPNDVAALVRARARWRVARLVGAAVGVLEVALIGVVARLLWGRRPALVAMALAAVYAPLAILSVTLLSEPLFVVWELAALAAVLVHRRQPQTWRWVLSAGVLAGLATLTRANGAVLLVPLGLLAWTARPRWTRRALAPPLALVAAAVLTVVPWTIRNAVVLHAFVPVSNDVGQTVAGTYNPLAARTHARWVDPFRLPPGFRPPRSMTAEPRRSAAMVRAGLRYVREHPAYAAVVGFWNTVRLGELDGAGRASLAGELRSRTLERISVVTFWGFLVLAVAGALAPAARHTPPLVWLVPAVLWLSVIVLVVNFSRFRAPLDPFVVMLAALALTRPALSEPPRVRDVRAGAAAR